MSSAEEAVTSLKNSVTCSICLESFINPLTLECGHSFCQKCIHEHWDRQELNRGPINCPECRVSFPQRPEPQKNVILCKVLEDLKVHDQKSLMPSEHTGSVLKVNRTVCLKHNHEFVFYCHTEKRCICCKCMLKSCRNHEIEAIEEEIKKRKIEFLNDLLATGHQKAQTKEEIEEWNHKTYTIKAFHDSVVDGVMTEFDKVQKMLESSRVLVIEYVRCEEKSAMAEAAKHIHHLQQHLEALNKFHTEIEQLLHTSDATFLESLPCSAAYGCIPAAPEIQLCKKEQMNAATGVLSEVTRMLQEDLPNALHPVAQIKETSKKSSSFKLNYDCCPREILDQSLIPQMETEGTTTNMSCMRAQLFKVFRNLTFDPKTANKYIEISHENRKAMHKVRSRSSTVLDSSQRFFTWQVMCSDGFSKGNHYWEVDVSTFFVQIGVAYESLKRTNEKANVIGRNSQSWSLELVNKQQSVWHSHKENILNARMYKRIGVHLDLTKGLLTFYGVTNVGSLESLHVFHSHFSEKVFPVFWIGEDVSVKICHIDHRALEDEQ